jgi:hypothetical protein
VVVASSTCDESVEVVFEYAGENATWIELAGVGFPISGGTDDHYDLRNTEADVASGDEHDHPHCAIGPKGRIHTERGVGDAANGLLDMPEDSSTCRVSIPTTSLYGINATRFLDGDCITVLVTNPTVDLPRSLRHGLAVGPPYLPLALRGIVVGGVMQPETEIVMKGKTRLKFELDLEDNVWRLAAQPVVYA